MSANCGIDAARFSASSAFSRASLELSPPPPPVAEADTKVQWLAENERRGGHDALARARDRPVAERSRSAALPAEHEAWRSEVARRHSRDADARAQGRLSEEPRHEGGRTRDGAKEAWRSEVERRHSRDATARAQARPGEQPLPRRAPEHDMAQQAWFAEVERRSSRDATTRARRRPPAF